MKGSASSMVPLDRIDGRGEKSIQPLMLHFKTPVSAGGGSETLPYDSSFITADTRGQEKLWGKICPRGSSYQYLSIFKCLTDCMFCLNVCVCARVGLYVLSECMCIWVTVCLPWRGPVVPCAVKEGSHIGLVSPGHVYHQHTWEEEERGGHDE